MPGMNASLTDAAFAIWDKVPKKKVSQGCDGRSAWISSVIVQHAGWVERYNKLLDQKLALQKELSNASRTIDSLQRRIHE